MSTRTKQRPFRALTAQKLQKHARENEAARIAVVDELAARYREAVQLLQIAQQNLQDRRNYEFDSVINSICCILEQGDEDWLIEDIVKMIREQSRIDVPSRPVSPIDVVGDAP